MAASRNKPSTDPVLAAVASCLGRYVAPGESIGVAYSGGLDSTVLLHAISRLDAREASLALHVHHGLSPRADEWAQFCADQCAAWGLPYRLDCINVSLDDGKGIEANARAARYRALRAHGTHWLLLAHHADDQAETLLFNLLRGAGVKGAAAMRERQGRLLRPLLNLPRTALMTYAQANGLDWIEDESNGDDRYTRNYLRLNVFPILKERFPRLTEQLSTAARRFAEAQELLDALADVDRQGQPPRFPLPMALFQALSPSRAANLLRHALAANDVHAPDEVRLKEFIRQLQEAAPDRHPRLDLPEYALWCSGRQIHFSIRTRVEEL